MKKRVLVLSCGSLIGTDINIALRNNDEFEVWGTSIYDNHGRYIYQNYISDIPNMNDSNFIDVLNKKIEEYKIEFIIPTHEDMCVFLQQNKEKINAISVCSNYETSLLCRYKTKTYEKMRDYDFIPKVYKKEDVKDYPVFVKKDNDQGARNAYKVDCKEQLDLYAKDNMIICEYLPGDEVTVDCFTDKKGILQFCNPRATDRMLAGIDVHARRIELTEEIKYIADSLNKEIEFRGCWFFQIKKDVNGKFKLLEMATRLAGSFSLSRCLDVNLPLMALKDFDGQDVKIEFNNIKIEADKEFFGRYSLGINYDTIYIDYKSCFENLDKIDTFFMMYLYQCLNKNININLIVDNKDDALNYLIFHKIDKNIFKQIIEIESKELKNILTKNSILLSNDDNMKSKIRNHNKDYCCFSNHIIEALIDWRA